LPDALGPRRAGIFHADGVRAPRLQAFEGSRRRCRRRVPNARAGDAGGQAVEDGLAAQIGRGTDVKAFGGFEQYPRRVPPMMRIQLASTSLVEARGKGRDGRQ